MKGEGVSFFPRTQYVPRPPSMQKRAAQSTEDGWQLCAGALAKGCVRMMNIPNTLTDWKESSGETPPGMAIGQGEEKIVQEH